MKYFILIITIALICCKQTSKGSAKPEENIDRILSKHFNDQGVNPHSLNPVYLKRTEAEEKHDKN